MRFSTIAVAASAASVASAVSICDKYTTALLTNNTAANQYALVTLLVKTAAVGNFTGKGTMNPTLPGSNSMLPGFLAPATYMGEMVNLEQYFTGALESTNVNGAPAAVNWLDSNATLLATDPLSLGEDGTNTQMLLTHLVQYFGVLLGCSTYGTPGFSTYQGSNSQYQVHKYMDLSEAEFSYFIAQTGASAASFGASMADVDSVAMALNTTFGYRCAAPAMVAPNTPKENQVMCVGSTCPLSPSPVAGCSGSDAIAGVVPSDAATATASATIELSGMAAATGTGAMTSASSTVMPYSPNAAPKTAAAGLFAAAGAVAAFFL